MFLLNKKNKIKHNKIEKTFFFFFVIKFKTKQNKNFLIKKKKIGDCRCHYGTHDDEDNDITLRCDKKFENNFFSL